MRKVTRRRVLMGTTAVAAVTAANSNRPAWTAAAHPVEPLIELERQWRARLNTAEHLPDDMPDDESQPYFDAVWAAGIEIYETPAQSFAGLAVKLRFYCHHAGLLTRSDSWGFNWTDEFGHAALRDAERLAGEGVS